MGTSTLDRILMGENSESKGPRYAPPAVFSEAEPQKASPVQSTPFVPESKTEPNKPISETDKMPMATKRENVAQPSSEMAVQGGQPKEAQPEQKAVTNAASEAQSSGSGDGDIVVPKRMSLAELYKKLNPQPTKEELAREEKRERRNKLFASLSDGISALANLYYTTQYAPNSFDPNKAQSKQLRDRYDKLRAERDAKKDNYIKALLRYEAEDNGNAIADARAALERKRQAELDAYNKEKDKADAERKDKAAEATENYRNANLKLKKAGQDDLARHRRIMENKPSKSSSKGSGGGHGDNNSYPLFNKNTGQWEHYKNEKTWIAKYTEIYGKLPDKVSTSVTDNSDMLNPKKTTTSSENVASYIGRKNAEHEQEYKNSRSNNKPQQKEQKKSYSHTKALGL